MKSLITCHPLEIKIDFASERIFDNFEAWLYAHNLTWFITMKPILGQKYMAGSACFQTFERTYTFRTKLDISYIKLLYSDYTLLTEKYKLLFGNIIKFNYIEE